MKVSTFILATKDTDTLKSREVKELFKYHVNDINQLEDYFVDLFGDSSDLNPFEQSIYDEMLDKLNGGYGIVATIETEEQDPAHARIVDFISRTGIHVINEAEI